MERRYLLPVGLVVHIGAGAEKVLNDIDVSSTYGHAGQVKRSEAQDALLVGEFGENLEDESDATAGLMDYGSMEGCQAKVILLC